MPGNPAGELERNQANLTLERFSGMEPPFDDAMQRARDLLNELRAPVQNDFQWIGWLGRRLDNSWHCYRPTTDRYSCKLMVVYVEPGGETPGIVTIGKMENGLAAIDAATDDALLEGRPIYLTPEETDSGL